MSTTNVSDNGYQIEPLKGEKNYMVWKGKMEDILTDLNLIDYVEGKTKKPEMRDTSTWTTNDRHALTAIRLRVSDSLWT